MRPRDTKRLFRFPSRSKADVRGDVHEEFSLHIDMRVDDLVRTGMDEADARAQAHREFGDLQGGLRACAATSGNIERRRWLARTSEDLFYDGRFALRLIKRNKGFSAVAVLTLAIAIGGNTAIFTCVNALMFKPLPVTRPQQLVAIHPGESRISWPNYVDLRDRNDVFTDVAAHTAMGLNVATGGLSVRLMGEAVTTNYFTTLGAGPAMGRTILPADTRNDVVVLSDRTWRRHFAADRSIVGRLVTIDQRAVEVVGVMPEGFRGLAPPGLLRELWIPIDTSPRNHRLNDRTAPQVEAFGRVKPGLTREQAQAAVQVLASRIRSEHPELNDRLLATRLSGVDGIDAFRGVAGALLPVLAFLGVLGVASGLVLLVGCANLAGLLLGRAAARQREIAIRLALGANRGRLIRQLLTESLALAMLGGALGTVLAVWAAGGANLALSQLPFPLEFDLTLDRRVLAYGFALSVVTALIFGLTPARRAARLDLVPSLKLDGGSAPAGQRLRKALVVAQAGVCTILLVWSGLFVRSLGQVDQVDPGFDASNVLLAEIDLPENAPDRAQTRGLLMKDLTDRLSVMPLVESTGFAWSVPLTLNSRMEYPVFLSTEPSGSAGTRVMGNRVTPGWFQTVRIPLEAGRDFTSQDRLGSQPVVIVNRTLADRLFDGNAVGRTLKLYGANDALVTVEIVGVVADSKYWTLGETIAPAVYQATYQHADGGTLHVRTAAPAAVMNAVRERVRVLAPGAATTFRSMSDATAVALMPARVGAIVTAAFGLLGTLLSVLGVYGLVAFLVAQRTREIGIRKAIGAGTWQIVRLVVGGSLALVLTGLVLGLVGGASSAQVLGGLLVNVSSGDPITLFAVALLVLGSAVAASAVPAARAARIDALITLKAE